MSNVIIVHIMFELMEGKMEHIKIIVMDMDGTLLTSDKIVTDYTKKVFDKLKENGYKLGIASGRPIIGVKRSVASLGIEKYIDFMVGSNGAELYDVSSGEENKFYQLEPEIVHEIIELYEPLGVNPYVYQGADCYAYRNDSTIQRAARNNHLGIVLCDLKEEVKTPQSKIVLSTAPEKMESIEEFYSKNLSEKYRAFKSQADMFEFVHPQLSKVYGIEYYCKRYGYSIAQAMSFGDTSNDIEMIRECGIGVCMCNGTDDAKEVADIISDYSNDEDGLAKVIEAVLSAY